MRLLLDTQAAIWWLGADPRLSAPARDAVTRARKDAGVSAASIWEASIKRAVGRLHGPELLGAASAADFPFLPIDEQHAKLAGELPLLHPALRRASRVVRARALRARTSQRLPRAPAVPPASRHAAGAAKRSAEIGRAT